MIDLEGIRGRAHHYPKQAEIDIRALIAEVEQLRAERFRLAAELAEESVEVYKAWLENQTLRGLLGRDVNP